MMSATGKRNVIKAMLAVLMMLALCTSSVQPAFAVSKATTADRPAVRSVDVSDNTVTVKWSKAKKATRYKVYVRTGPNEWKYLKKVKKTAANRKKYSNKINYKIKTSGKKYKVYKRTNLFRLAATVKERSYTFEGEYGTSYAFIIKPYAGKTAGTRSKIKVVSIPEKQAEPEPEPQPQEDLSQPDQANVDAVKAYAAKLYSENMTPDRDYLKGDFSWDQEIVIKRESNADAGTRGWLYFNGLMMEALLTADPANSEEIMRFYDSHINSNGEQMVSASKIFPVGSLDNLMPAAVMLRLVNEGFTDDERTEKYNKAANYIYNKLEQQIMFDGKDGRPYAGKLWLHHQVVDNETGEFVPAKSWSKWKICLDGIYMSQLYLMRLAEAIDSGKMTIIANGGHTVTADELWDDIYTRMVFVMEHMRIKETGLLAHVYSPADDETNEITWGRGMGWFTMVMLEAAEKMPDETKRQTLQEYYDSLMRSVIEWQDSDSLLWYNVVTQKTELSKNKPETSGSSMFAYCLLKGYQDGILKDEAFRIAGIKAFNAMVKYHYNETDGLTDTLISMGPGSTPQAYQNPAYVNNEAKGVGPLIMASEYVVP